MTTENEQQSAIETAASTEAAQTQKVEVAQDAGDAVQQTAETGGKFTLSRNVIIIGVAAVVLIAALIAVIVLFAKSADKQSVLYIKDSELNLTYLSEDSKPFEITSRLMNESLRDTWDHETAAVLSALMHYSEKSNLLFYPDRLSDTDEEYGLSLYFRDLSKGEEDSGTRIDTDMWLDPFYQVNDSGNKIFYLKGEARNLYVHDMQNREKLAGDVEQFYVNPAGNEIVYLKEDGGLYYRHLDKEDEKIDNSANSVQISSDFKSIHYIKNDSVYVYTVGGDKEKLISSARAIGAVLPDGAFYFTKQEDREIGLIDYVIDDLASEDANNPEPMMEDFQYEVERVDWWGDTYYTMDIDYDAYSDAIDVYYEKEERNNLREELRNDTVQRSSSTLYYYDGKEEVALSDNISEIILNSPTSAFIMYRKYIQSDVPKVNLSEITSTDAVRDLIDASRTWSDDIYTAFKGEEASLEQEEAVSFALNSSGSKLYFIDEYSYEDDYGTLVSVDISGSKLGEVVKVDDDVAKYRFRPGSDTILYYKDINDSDSYGDLYMDGKLIDSDVSLYVDHVVGLSDSSNLVYLVDFDEDYGYGTLKLYDGKTKVKIADDVSNFDVLADNSVLYIADYDADRIIGDLYIYDGSEKSRRIDTDVSGMISSGPESMLKSLVHSILSYQMYSQGWTHVNPAGYVSESSWLSEWEFHAFLW